MDILYKTIGGEGFGEIVVEKSRFIARLRPVRSRAEADVFFGKIRRQHHDARHNVPCFVIGAGMQEQWSSEDGEPQGTAGAPMLQLLVGEGVTYAAAMVTRYFGGIKLGTGGLARAYTSALKAALGDAGIVSVAAGVALRYRMSYPAFEKFRSAAAARDGIGTCDASYGEAVDFTVTGLAEQEEDIRRLAAAAAAGASPTDVRATEIFLKNQS